MDHSLTWRDIFQGHAEVHLDAAAALRLAEKAGAPWNESDPNAKLSDVQIEIITAPERTVVVFGGSRGGKSIAGACIGLAQLVIPNSRIALVGANYEHCSKEFGYIWKGFFNLFPKSAAVKSQFITRSPHYSMMLETVWGSHIQVYSVNAKEGQTLLGNEFDLAILCEAAQVNPDVYHVKLERALMGRAKKRTGQDYLRRTGRAILLTTPAEQGGASYEVYARAMQRTKGRIDRLLLENGAGWFDSVYFRECSVIEMNPTYPREAFEAARRTLPRHAFEEQFLGKAIIRSGLCYSSFRETTHVIEKDSLPGPDVIRKSLIGVGIDTGNNFAAVLSILTPDEKMYVIGEAYEVGQTTKEDAAAVDRMIDEVLGSIFPNPKDAVQLWVVDVNSQHIMDLEDILGVDFVYQKHDVNESIGALDIRMGDKCIFFSEEVHFTLNEIRQLRWKRSKPSAGQQKKDKPTGDDHAMDAFRYLAMQMFEQGPPLAAAVELSFDEMMAKERDAMLRPSLKKDMESWKRKQWETVLGGVW